MTLEMRLQMMRRWSMLSREMVRKNHMGRVAKTLKLILAVLMHIISQLRPGADLSRVTLPTFILEPRSMLERITKYDSSKS